MSSTALDVVLRRDRVVIAASLVVLSMLSWTYLVWLADDMWMGGMEMTGFRMIPAGQGLMVPQDWPWGPIEVAYVLLMWSVMMVGMMTPSAAPAILVYAMVGRKAALDGKPFAGTAWFATGYLLAWIGFSIVATVAQWGLERIKLLTPMMETVNPIFGGLVLIASGIYQWTPFKDACLRQCQMPLVFIHRHGGFRRDALGSLGLGMRHGAYCVGCCWALMALLFIGGVMNVLWIAALAILVMVEKVVPAGRVIARLIGIGSIGWGVLLLQSALR